MEGLITAAVLCFIHQARPDLLWGVPEDALTTENPLSVGKTLGIIGVAAALVGGILSLFASAFPDGLEWPMERVAGTSELESQGGIYDVAAGIQEKLSFLPDYAFPGSESAAGTTVSGLVGAAIVVAVCLALAYGLKFYQHKKQS